MSNRRSNTFTILIFLYAFLLFCASIYYGATNPGIMGFLIGYDISSTIIFCFFNSVLATLEEIRDTNEQNNSEIWELKKYIFDSKKEKIDDNK